MVHAAVAHVVQKCKMWVVQRVQKVTTVAHHVVPVARAVPAAHVDLVVPAVVAQADLVVPVATATIVAQAAHVDQAVPVVVVPADLVVNVQMVPEAQAGNVLAALVANVRVVPAVSAQVVLVQAHVVRTQTTPRTPTRVRLADLRMTRQVLRALTQPPRADNVLWAWTLNRSSPPFSSFKS